jgi:transcription antitermination protein NusB
MTMADTQPDQSPAKPPKQPKPTAKARRTAARLAAVQALYQIELSGSPSEQVLGVFLDLRLGHEVDGDRYVPADTVLLASIVRIAVERDAEVRAALAAVLDTRYPLERLEAILRQILRCAAAELLALPDTLSAVIINDYVDVAHGFFAERQPSMANAILIKLAQSVRGDAERKGR